MADFDLPASVELSALLIVCSAFLWFVHITTVRFLLIRSRIALFLSAS
jgi:hypothetical protein